MSDPIERRRADLETLPERPVEERRRVLEATYEELAAELDALLAIEEAD